MYSFMTAVFAFAIASGSGSAQVPQYTNQSLKVAMRTASRPADFDKLAAYFEESSVRYHAVAEEHGRTLSHELESPTFGSKYPTAVDRARRLKEYYLEQARKAHEQSEHYRKLAERSSGVDAGK